MSVKKLLNEIDRGQIKSLYIFYGEEQGYIDDVIDKLTDSQYKKLYNIKDLKTVLNGDLFSNNESLEYYVMKYNEYIINHDISNLVDRLNNQILILVFNKIDKRKKFFKDSKPYLYEFKQLTNSELNQYITQRLNMNSKNANYIITACDSDLAKIKQEMHKLAHLNLITEEKIRQLVIRDPVNEIFNFIDSIIYKDPRAYKLYYDLNSLGEHPLKYISLLYDSLKIIYILQVKPDISDKQVNKDYGYNPYRVRMHRDKTKNWYNNDILDTLKELHSLEINIKTGKEDPKIGFENLLNNIFKKAIR